MRAVILILTWGICYSHRTRRLSQHFTEGNDFWVMRGEKTTRVQEWEQGAHRDWLWAGAPTQGVLENSSSTPKALLQASRRRSSLQTICPIGSAYGSLAQGQSACVWRRDTAGSPKKGQVYIQLEKKPAYSPLWQSSSGHSHESQSEHWQSSLLRELGQENGKQRQGSLGL